MNLRTLAHEKVSADMLKRKHTHARTHTTTLAPQFATLLRL